MNGNAKEVIQEEEMDNIMLALNNDIDSIILTLNNLKMKLYDTKEYFKGDVADNFNDKFEDYFAQYEVLKDNPLFLMSSEKYTYDSKKMVMKINNNTKELK